ncbi:hypothetical protein MMC26_003224 [Xylographa opegraphella]|nr:hypothetical protein [Xylographa opegraphella]
MQQSHSTSEIVRTWWHAGLEAEISEFDDATIPPSNHIAASKDECESDGVGLNLDLELLNAKCADVMPLEILYRTFRDSYRNGSSISVNKSKPRRQRPRPLSAPASLPSTSPDPMTSLSQPQRESSEYTFADNIMDIIETMLDHALTTQSPILKGLSGKPLQVEDALVAVTRGEYSTDTLQEDYLPNGLQIPLRLPLKAITEEQEDASPTDKEEQRTLTVETDAFMAELEGTSMSNNRGSGSSSLSYDPMGMFNYDYLEPSEWYDTQPLLFRSKKNAGIASATSSSPITPKRVPIIHSLISPFPPPNKPLPALPPGVSFQKKRCQNAMAPTMSVSSCAPVQLLQTNIYHKTLESDENFRREPLYSSYHTTLEPGFVADPNTKQEAQENPEANIHPLFRKGSQSSQENSLSSLPNKHKSLSTSTWSGMKHSRGLSDISNRSTLSHSLPHSNPPSSYLCSPPPSPKAPSVTESDPFTSPKNELSHSILRLSSASTESRLQARTTLNKSASLGGDSLKKRISLEKATSIRTRASLGRSSSYATRASLKSGISNDQDDSCSDFISFDKSVSLDRSAPVENPTSIGKLGSVTTRPSLEKRTSLKQQTSLDYASSAESIAPSKRPTLGRLISLDSSASGASSVHRSTSMKTTGADAPFILHEYRPQKRLSIDCIREYAQAIDEIHGLERVKPLDPINENSVNVPKEQFRILPTGLTSPSVSQLSLRNGPDKPWPMKKKSSNLRRAEAIAVANTERESSSTLSSGSTHPDTVMHSASLTVPIVEDLDTLDDEDPFGDPERLLPSPRKRSGRMAELLALRVEEDKQAAARRQLKEQREREGKMAKLLRRAQSLEKVGEGFKKLFSVARKDDARLAEAGGYQ